MSSSFIEPEPELELILMPAPGEEISGSEFQSELGVFTRALGTHGIKASRKWFANDAIGGGGWGAGEITLLASTLGPVAIVELRKGIIAFLKMREGRKLKLKFGTSTIEGRVDDIQKIITPEEISKLLEPPKKLGKKTGHG